MREVEVKWPVQVLLLHLTGSSKGSGLSEELPAAQLTVFRSHYLLVRTAGLKVQT